MYYFLMIKKFFVIVVFFLVFCGNTFAQNVQTPTNTITPSVAINREHIEDFQTDIGIRKNGQIHVKETILYDFSTLSRHGIYRTIPYTKINSDKKTFELLFTGFSVTDETGKTYRFSKSKTNNTITLKIGDPNRTITGSHIYVISYDVSGALGYFDNHDEIFWNVTGTEWNVPIKSAGATVNLPANIKESIKTSCYTGGFGSKESNCTIDQKENFLTFKTNSFLSANNGLTAVVGFPKGTVATLLPQEKIPFFDTALGKVTLVLIVAGLLLWYIILPILLVIIWLKYGRDPYVGKAVRAWFDPPQTKSGRVLTPAETAGLVDETVDNRDIFATIIDLARRGYVIIKEEKKGNFTIIKQSAFLNDKDLQSHEKDLLAAIFENSHSVKIKDKNLYQDIVKIKTNLYKTMLSEGFFRHNPQTIRTVFYVIGFLGLISGNFLLFITALIFGHIMPRKTLFGAQQATVGKGLKNFLSSQERQLKFQADKQMFFEKLLPFAVAFGVEKIWAARFAKFDLKPPTWYKGYSGSTFNSVIFANSLSSSYSSFSSASHPPASTSSGFGGGGFSGGGGGGGGGGSW